MYVLCTSYYKYIIYVRQDLEDTILVVHKDFANRFTLLRKTYKLTYSDCAEIFGAKYKTTISEWVNSSNWPNGAMLKLISNVFGVSLDWLLGNDDQPYRDNLLLKLETEHALPILQMVFSPHFSMLPDRLPGKYIDSKQRVLFYTQGQRANIIFAAMSSFTRTLFAKFTFKEIEKGDLSLKGVQNTVETYNLLNGYLSSIKEIDSLLSGNLKSPVFDLEAMIKNTTKKEECQR